MPELPEVENVRLGLLKALPGQKIVSAEVLREQSIAYPTTYEFVSGLTGRSVKDITRRGKYLLFTLQPKSVLVVHLGMSGRLLLVKKGKQTGSHVRVRLRLSNGDALCFDDVRVFGHLWLVRSGQKITQVIPGLARLGVEPFAGLTAQHLLAVLSKRKLPIKAALLDQTVLAGLGNIYADESLFRAGIHPQCPAQKLTLAELTNLCAWIQKVLKEAIELGGSTLANYTDSYGVNGRYQRQAWVYGRRGKPCRLCGTAIAGVRLAGRSSCFCPYCQTLPNYRK